MSKYMKQIRDQISEMDSGGLVGIIESWHSKANVELRNKLNKIRAPMKTIFQDSYHSFFLGKEGKKEGLPESYTFTPGKEEKEIEDLLEKLILDTIRESFGEKSKLYQTVKEEGMARTYSAEIFGANFDQLVGEMKRYKDNISKFIDEELSDRGINYIIQNKVKEDASGLIYQDFAKYNIAQMEIMKKPLDHYDTLIDKTAGILDGHKFKKGTDVREMLGLYVQHLEGALSDSHLYDKKHMFEPVKKKDKDYDYAHAA
jgi:hypothetical protein